MLYNVAIIIIKFKTFHIRYIPSVIEPAYNDHLCIRTTLTTLHTAFTVLHIGKPPLKAFTLHAQVFITATPTTLNERA